MNAGIVTTFVVGGILLLAVLTLNFTLMESSAQSTTSLISKTHVETVSQMIRHDLMRINYTKNADLIPGSPIQKAKKDEIQFLGDIDGDDVVDQVTWKLSSTMASATKNPADAYLVRIVNGTATEYSVGVTSLTFCYATPSMDIEDCIDNPDSGSRPNINQIQVGLVSESSEPVGTTTDADGKIIDEYQRSVWHKVILPPNQNRFFK